MRKPAREGARVFTTLAVGPYVQNVELLNGWLLCVNALAEELTITPAVVSQHVRVPRDNELAVPNEQ